MNGFFGKPPACQVWDCRIGITATALIRMPAFCRPPFELRRMRQIHCSPQTVTRTSTTEPDSFPHPPLVWLRHFRVRSLFIRLAVTLTARRTAPFMAASAAGWVQFPRRLVDPIFWLHHCNIDRLWNRWLAGGGGRANPPSSDTVWHNTKFTFFDEFGEQVQMTGAELLNPNVCGCRTCYDEETVFTIWPILTERLRLVEIQIGILQETSSFSIARRLKFEIESQR